MGRSFGGGGRSGGGGGFRGGGRSFGGFSGGRRNGGRSFGAGPSGPRGGWGFTPPRPPRRIYGGGGSGLWPFLAGMSVGRSQSRAAGGARGTSQAAGGDGSPEANGCAKGCLAAIVLVIVVIVITMAFGSFASCARSDGSVGASTHQREALAAGSAVETGYYTDESGDWIRDSAALERGLETFFAETGVQPYVYILPNGTSTSESELAARAEELYDELFTDEAHFLLVFCDDGQGSYTCGYAVGSAAKTIMDDEAIGILADYLDRNYLDLSLSEEEIFADTFAQTAERIMHVTTSPVVYIAGAAAVVAIVALVIYLVRRRSQERAAERAHVEEMLNTPLETFGDQKLDDLEEKYR